MKTIAVFEKGFYINALYRNKSTITLSHNNLNIIEGNILKFSNVKSVIEGSGYVICAIGTKPPFKDVFCSEGTKNIIKGMYDYNLTRLTCITGAMIGDYPGILSGFMNKLKLRFNKSYPLISLDRLKQEMAIKASGLNWTILKPPRLTESSLSKYKMSENLRITGFSSISRKTIASLIFDIIENESTYQKTLFVKK